jgi:GTP-binding protein Era
MTAAADGFRSGMVALAGRPNVGKSTLLNTLLGRKLAIMSDRPQTTRSVVRGVLHRPEGQAVLVDTPGLHRPRTLLGERLNNLVRGTLAEVDLICLLVDAQAGIGRGDRFLATELNTVDTPRFALVNKVDAATREQTVAALAAIADAGDWAEIVPLSARTGEGVELLVELLMANLPEGRPLYPPGHVSDEPEQHLLAEIIREKALGKVRDELPHSIAVVIEEMGTDLDGTGVEPSGDAGHDRLTIRATLYVERPSQKPIVIGRGGAVLRDIGKAARAEIQQLLGTRVHLDLHVKVAKEWQGDPKLLARLGF